MSTVTLSNHTMNAREQRWARFLVSLTEDERARLFKDDEEMVAHDEFVAGKVPLADIRLMLNMDEDAAS